LALCLHSILLDKQQGGFFMKTSEKISQSRGYVSPSLADDKKTVENFNLQNMDWKAPVAMAAGGLLLARFPKTSLLGLLAAGVYFGIKAYNKNQNPFKGEGIADLH
jgi:hypothetical protein